MRRAVAAAGPASELGPLLRGHRAGALDRRRVDQPGVIGPHVGVLSEETDHRLELHARAARPLVAAGLTRHIREQIGPDGIGRRQPSVPHRGQIDRTEAPNDRAILTAMPLVLLTGSERRVMTASRSLAEAGCHCLTATSPWAVAAALRRLGDERLAAYVQLPVEVSDVATTAVGRIRELLTEGLVARYAAAEMAAESVGDGGVIVLVAGNSPAGRQVPDDVSARYALLRVLSRAITADCAERNIRCVVLPSDATMADVTGLVLDQPPNPGPHVCGLDERDSDDGDWFLWFDGALDRAPNASGARTHAH